MSKKELTKKVAGAVVATSVLSALQKRAAPYQSKLKKLNVTKLKTKQDYDVMASTMKALKAIGKEADKQLKSITDPLEQSKKNARALFAPFTTMVNDWEEECKTQMLAFVNLREEKAAVLLIGGGDNGTNTSIKKAVAKQNELLDNNNTRKIWRLKITNPKLIPSKYLVPNEQLIKDDLQSGKKVPGCQMVQENTIAI